MRQPLVSNKAPSFVRSEPFAKGLVFQSRTVVELLAATLALQSLIVEKVVVAG